MVYRNADAQSPVHDNFLSIYLLPEVVEVPFNEEWNNGTGYFDAAVKADVNLPVGTRFRSLAKDDSGERRILGVVTPIGNVILFERYYNGDRGYVICQGIPGFTALFHNGPVDETQLRMFAGDQYSKGNVGVILDKIISGVMTTDYKPVYTKRVVAE